MSTTLIIYTVVMSVIQNCQLARACTSTSDTSMEARAFFVTCVFLFLGTQHPLQVTKMLHIKIKVISVSNVILSSNAKWIAFNTKSLNTHQSPQRNIFVQCVKKPIWFQIS